MRNNIKNDFIPGKSKRYIRFILFTTLTLLILGAFVLPMFIPIPVTLIMLLESSAFYVGITLLAYELLEPLLRPLITLIEKFVFDIFKGSNQITELRKNVVELSTKVKHQISADRDQKNKVSNQMKEVLDGLNQIILKKVDDSAKTYSEISEFDKALFKAEAYIKQQETGVLSKPNTKLLELLLWTPTLSKDMALEDKQRFVDFYNSLVEVRDPQTFEVPQMSMTGYFSPITSSRPLAKINNGVITISIGEVAIELNDKFIDSELYQAIKPVSDLKMIDTEDILLNDSSSTPSELINHPEDNEDKNEQLDNVQGQSHIDQNTYQVTVEGPPNSRTESLKTFIETSLEKLSKPFRTDDTNSSYVSQYAAYATSWFSNLSEKINYQSSSHDSASAEEASETLQSAYTGDESFHEQFKALTKQLHDDGRYLRENIIEVKNQPNLEAYGTTIISQRLEENIENFKDAHWQGHEKEQQEMYTNIIGNLSFNNAVSKSLVVDRGQKEIEAIQDTEEYLTVDEWDLCRKHSQDGSLEAIYTPIREEIDELRHHIEDIASKDSDAYSIASKDSDAYSAESPIDVKHVRDGSRVKPKFEKDYLSLIKLLSNDSIKDKISRLGDIELKLYYRHISFNRELAFMALPDKVVPTSAKRDWLDWWRENNPQLHQENTQDPFELMMNFSNTRTQTLSK